MTTRYRGWAHYARAQDYADAVQSLRLFRMMAGDDDARYEALKAAWKASKVAAKAPPPMPIPVIASPGVFAQALQFARPVLTIGVALGVLSVIAGAIYLSTKDAPKSATDFGLEEG